MDDVEWSLDSVLAPVRQAPEFQWQWQPKVLKRIVSELSSFCLVQLQNVQAVQLARVY